MIKTTAWLFFASILLSYLTILLPETSGVTVGIFENRQTQTTEFVRDIYASGFPLKFYIPGGYDYGANFMTEAFIANTVIVFIICILSRKFISKQK